jgi:hypothetical protein
VSNHLRNQEADEGRREGLLPELVSGAMYHLREMAVSYLFLARETAREEVRHAGRATIWVGIFLIVFALGLAFAAAGFGTMVGEWAEDDGFGFLVSGGGLVVLAIFALMVLLRDRR